MIASHLSRRYRTQSAGRDLSPKPYRPPARIDRRFAMVKMAKRPFEALTELLNRELDDRLRVVLRIDSAGIERLFVRDDLSLGLDDELGQSFARGFPRAREPADLLPVGAGGPDCLVGFNDETVDLLLYGHPNEVVAIEFDRGPEDALEEFVERCLAAMR